MHIEPGSGEVDFVLNLLEEFFEGFSRKYGGKAVELLEHKKFREFRELVSQHMPEFIRRLETGKRTKEAVRWLVEFSEANPTGAKVAKASFKSAAAMLIDLDKIPLIKGAVKSLGKTEAGKTASIVAEIVFDNAIRHAMGGAFTAVHKNLAEAEEEEHRPERREEPAHQPEPTNTVFMVLEVTDKPVGATRITYHLTNTTHAPALTSTVRVKKRVTPAGPNAPASGDDFVLVASEDGGAKGDDQRLTAKLVPFRGVIAAMRQLGFNSQITVEGRPVEATLCELCFPAMMREYWLHLEANGGQFDECLGALAETLPDEIGELKANLKVHVNDLKAAEWISSKQWKPSLVRAWLKQSEDKRRADVHGAHEEPDTEAAREAKVTEKVKKRLIAAGLAHSDGTKRGFLNTITHGLIGR